MFSINQGTNEDDSQSDPHPEAGLLTSGREDRHDMATGVQRESTQAHDMVTGVTEQIRSQRDMVTGITEQILSQRDMVKGVTEQIRSQRDMVTGVTEQIRSQRDIVTGVHEEVMYCSPSTSSGKQKRTALQVNPNFAAKTPLRRLRQTKFCWHFSSWQTTTILQSSITILTEFPNCQSHLRQRCQPLMANLKSSSCSKICSKRVSKSTIS